MQETHPSKAHIPVTPVLGYRSWNNSSGMIPWRTWPPFSGRGGTGARLWDEVCREWEDWTSLWMSKAGTALAI